MSGGVTAFSEYASFVILTLFISNILVDNAISFTISLFVGFTLNKLWVFKSSGDYKKQASAYIVLSIINLGLGSVLILFFAELLHLHPLIAKLLTMAIIATCNYLVFSRLIFRSSDKTKVGR